MRPAGLAAVAAAVADGSWTLLDAVEDLIEPEDLTAALDALPAAREGWDGLSPSARKAGLLRIATAKRPETRARRIEETVRLAAEPRPTSAPAAGPQPDSTPRISRSLAIIAFSPSLTRVAPMPMKPPSLAASALAWAACRIH